MDWIEGNVIRIVDGDTFDLDAQSVGPGNQETYSKQERIRVADIDAPEAGTSGADLATEMLRQQYQGKYVRCDIYSRDTYGRLVCRVKA